MAELMALHVASGIWGWIIMPLWGMPIWYAAPLIVAISLVHGATRFERMQPILTSAAHFAGWVILFMIVLYGVIRLMSLAL